MTSSATSQSAGYQSQRISIFTAYSSGPSDGLPSADPNSVYLLVSFESTTFSSQKSPFLTHVKKRCQQVGAPFSFACMAKKIQVKIIQDSAFGIMAVVHVPSTSRQAMVFLRRLPEAAAWKKREFSSHSGAIRMLKRWRQNSSFVEWMSCGPCAKSRRSFASFVWRGCVSSRRSKRVD